MDLRVLEVGDNVAAAYAGKLFARWGADVIRVDKPRPAIAASSTPRERALESFLHPGKRRATIAYTQPEGRALLDAIAARCDLLLFDLAPSALDALDWTALGVSGAPTARVSITPFGLTGPRRDWQATGATLLALGGYTFLSGDPGRAPLTLPGHLVEYQSGQFAFIAGLSAVLAGDVPASETAATIEISMQECVATLSQFTTVMWTHNRLVRSRHGNRWENLQPNAMYRCADGWYQASGIGKFWEPFAWMIGRPDLLEDSRFLTPELRTQNVAALEEVINGALGDRGMLEILTEAQETWRVPVGIGLSLAGVLDDPHLQSRGFWQETVVSDDGRVKTPGSPFTFVGEERPAEPLLSDPVEPLPLIAALGREVE